MAFATPLEMIKREAASTKDDELMRNAWAIDCLDLAELQDLICSSEWN